MNIPLNANANLKSAIKLLMDLRTYHCNIKNNYYPNVMRLFKNNYKLIILIYF